MRYLKRLRKRQLNELVAEACRLVDHDDVRSVRIVGGGRPSFAQMRRYRNAARHDHVQLSVDGHGTITVRPEACK